MEILRVYVFCLLAPSFDVMESTPKERALLGRLCHVNNNPLKSNEFLTKNMSSIKDFITHFVQLL